MILGLTAAVATALLLGLIARDDVGMSADMIRIDALSVAGIIFAAVASGSLLRRKKYKHFAGVAILHKLQPYGLVGVGRAHNDPLVIASFCGSDLQRNAP